MLFGQLAVSGRLLPGLSVLVMGLAVALRRRFPATAGTTAAVLQSLTIALHGDPQIVTNAICYFLALYALAVWTSTRRFVLGLAAVAATLLVPSSRGDRFLWTAVSVVVMLIVRRVVRDREARAELAERERDLAAHEAVAEERARIARELHDVVAHTVSVMVVQAQAGPRLLGDAERRPRRVRRDRGQRPGGADASCGGCSASCAPPMSRRDLAPQPGLGALDALVRAGARPPVCRSTLRVEGEPVDCPPGVDLSAYRIVQEALTNTLKHAGRAEARSDARYATGGARARDRRQRRRLRGDRRGSRARPDRHARAGRALRRRARRRRPQRPRLRRARARSRSTGTAHEHPRPDRRRPGARPHRLPRHPRRRARHRGGRRGGRRTRGRGRRARRSGPTSS